MITEFCFVIFVFVGFCFSVIMCCQHCIITFDFVCGGGGGGDDDQLYFVWW
jgi:hypothetical protein